MTKGTEFEKLSEIYGAIKSIDRIVASDSKEKLDNVLVALKDIKKEEFDSDITLEIINGYRNALLKIYQNIIGDLNTSIENIDNKTENNDDKTLYHFATINSSMNKNNDKVHSQNNDKVHSHIDKQF